MNDREQEEFERIRLVERMDRDWTRISEYRENEKYYINRLVTSARRVGQLDARLA